MEFGEIPEFKIDFKRLQKKYRSLENDFNNLKKILQGETFEICKEKLHMEHYGGFKPAQRIEAYKIRKFRCQSLSCTDKIRIIICLIFHKKIYFISIYHHNENPTEKQEQITKATIQNFLEREGFYK